MANPDRKCYVVLCPLYPTCARSAGSCCAIEWGDSENRFIREDECYNLPDHPLYIKDPKKGKPYRPN